jgi:predicted Zn-dependent peptidase
MSQITRRELFPGVWLRAVHTNKFKSAYLSVTMLAPLDGETAAENALVPFVLRRGTAAHPDMEAMSAALDELYGGAIEPAVRKKGETQCVGFVASFLDDAYALEGEKILDAAAALLGEVLLRPYTQNGVFSSDYTAGEKANLANRIRAQINDKRTYATHRLVQLMCGEEAFGVDKLGDEAHVEAVTPQSLWSRYQALLNQAAIEVYYCGSAHPDRVAEAMKAALAALPVNRERVVPDCEIRLSVGQEPNTVEESMDASSMLEKQKGLLLVSSGIEFDKYQTARDEIMAQLEAVRRGEIEDWELEGARRTLVGMHLATLDDQARQEEFWLGQAVAGLDATVEELAAQMETVTREQVAQAARKLELDTVYFLKGKEE